MAVTKYKQVFQGENPIQRKHLRMDLVKPKIRPAHSLGDAQGMSTLSCLEGDGLIGLLFHPDGKEDAYPHIGQRPHGHRMAFALGSFALIIGFGPGLCPHTVISKLVEDKAPRFDTAQTSMRFLILPALKQDRRSASQRMPRTGGSITISMVADFREQAGSQARPSPRQGLEQFMVFMLKKKAFNLLVIVSNLTYLGLQLVQQCHEPPRFGAGRDFVGRELGLLQHLDKVLRFALCSR